MERIAMSQEERDWLEWLKRVQGGVVTQRQAAAKMGVSDRWVRKLLRRMEADGDGVVVHGLRGRSSNRQIDEQTQARAIVLLKQPEWYDFGPTFASEQLAKRHDIRVSKETVRGWMVAAGLWKAQSRKLGEAHFWRPRRSGYGEWVQWDTSNHDWAGGQRRSRALPGEVDRRCHQPQRGTVRAARRDAREHGRVVAIRGRQRADGGSVHRPGGDLHGGAAGQGKRPAAPGGGSLNAVRPRPARGGNRLDPGILTASQGAGGTKLRHRPGSSRKALATSQSEDHAGCQQVSGSGVLAGGKERFARPLGGEWWICIVR